MDDKQDITVTMQISLPKQEATAFAELLQTMLNLMHVEGIVSYTTENKKTTEEILIELGYYPNEIKKILGESDEP